MEVRLGLARRVVAWVCFGLLTSLRRWLTGWGAGVVPSREIGFASLPIACVGLRPSEDEEGAKKGRGLAKRRCRASFFPTRS